MAGRKRKEKQNSIRESSFITGFFNHKLLFQRKTTVRIHLEINSKASGAGNNLKFMSNQRQNKYQIKTGEEIRILMGFLLKTSKSPFWLARQGYK